MKIKGLFFALFFSCSVLANTSSINAVSTLPLSQYVSVEAPLRCAIEEFKSKAISTNLVLKKDHLMLKRTEPSDKLPRYRVNGATITRTPVDQVVQMILEEAGITVYTNEKVYPTVSIKNVYGELDKVLDGLAQAGEFFYTYSEKDKSLLLEKYARFEIDLPQDTVLMLALLDAFRGSGIVDIIPNWNNASISLMLTKEQFFEAENILKSMLEDGKFLLIDVNVYAINAPKPGIDWQDVIIKGGIGKVNSTFSGLVGKMITIGHTPKSENWVSMITKEYPIDLLSKGILVVPNNWKSRFDIGRCATEQKKLNALSVLLSPKIQNAKNIETVLTLDTTAGEVSSFKAQGGLDEEFVVVGIPATVVGLTSGELLITFKIRLIRLTKET